MSTVRVQRQLTSNKTVHLPEGRVRRLTVGAGTSNLHIIGHPKGTVCDGIVITGGNGNTMPPQSGDAVECTYTGPTYLNYDSGKSSLEAVDGDYVWIYPVDESGEPLEEPTVPRFIGGFMAEVAYNVDGELIYRTGLTSPFFSSDQDFGNASPDLTTTDVWEGFFSLYSWKVYKLDVNVCKNITIENVNFSGKYSAGAVIGVNDTPNLLSTFYVDGLTIRNCKFKNSWGQCSYLVRCMNILVDNIYMKSCGDQNSGNGYALELQQCNQAIVTNIVGERASRAVSIDGSAYAVVVRNVRASNMRGSLIDWHGGMGFGMIWADVRQVGLPNMTFADEQISLGNATHKGVCWGVNIKRCSATEIQILHNSQVEFDNISCFLINAAGTGGIMSGPRRIKFNGDRGPSSITREIQSSSSPVDGTIIEINEESFPDGFFWGASFIRILDTSANDYSIYMNNVTMQRQTNSISHMSFAGTGDLHTEFSNVSFTGGSGTRVVVSAPTMTNAGGLWSNVTCNGTPILKLAGQDSA